MVGQMLWQHLYTSVPPILYRTAIRRIPSDNSIAITFDDGPDPVSTVHALDSLSRYNVKATFFVLGEKCTMYPDIVKQVVSEGHQIGSHGYSHFRHVGARKRIADSLDRTRDIIAEITGSEPRLFRPPYGWWLGTNNDLLTLRMLRLTLWSCMPGDYLEQMSTARLSNTISRYLRGGDVLVLHDNGRTGDRISDYIESVAEYMNHASLTTSLITPED